MTLETIYYIGQTIAVIAILGSLIAIYLQQRRTNQIEKGKTQFEISNQAISLSWNALTDEKTVDALRACLHDYQGAGHYQQARFSAYVIHVMELCEQAYSQAQYKLVRPELSESYIHYALSIIKTPGGKQWWEAEGANIYSADLVSYLTTRIESEAENIPPLTEVFAYLRPKNKAV